MAARSVSPAYGDGGRFVSAPLNVGLQPEGALLELKMLLIVMVTKTVAVVAVGAAGLTVASIGVFGICENAAVGKMERTVAVVAVFSTPPTGVSCPEERWKFQESRSD
jgi:hypothetical protein